MVARLNRMPGGWANYFCGPVSKAYNTLIGTPIDGYAGGCAASIKQAVALSTRLPRGRFEPDSPCISNASQEHCDP
jgi:hypothetical protein